MHWIQSTGQIQVIVFIFCDNCADPMEWELGDHDEF